MFELVESMLTQLVLLMPSILGVYILFDLLGSMFFGRR